MTRRASRRQKRRALSAGGGTRWRRAGGRTRGRTWTRCRRRDVLSKTGWACRTGCCGAYRGGPWRSGTRRRRGGRRRLGTDLSRLLGDDVAGLGSRGKRLMGGQAGLLELEQEQEAAAGRFGVDDG